MVMMRTLGRDVRPLDSKAIPLPFQAAALKAIGRGFFAGTLLWQKLLRCFGDLV
jgi:hypothetical protein